MVSTNQVTAGIALVIDYRQLGISDRRYFRFRGASGDNWQWLPQPSDEIEAVAGRAVDDRIRRVAELKERLRHIGSKTQRWVILAASRRLQL